MPGIDTYTKLMLHFNGADGSTTCTDSSSSARTMTRTGDPEIDTAQSKFGGASGLFNSGRWQAPDDADLEFGSSDFTMDMWVRASSWAGGYHSICMRGSGADYYTGFLHNGTSLYFPGTTNNGGYNFSPLTAITGVTLATNTWHHIAASRSGNNLYLFFDGVLKETRSVTGLSVYNFTHGWCVGSDGGGASAFAGWIDELRISVGTARWTADFTPPTAEYSAPITLTADAGSYALTGIAATLNAGKTIIIEAGSYALTGVAAAFAAVISMPAAAGSYVLTGVDAVLAQGKVLISDAGSYALTGVAALQKISINAVVGAYTLTGVSAAVQYTMNTLAGAYTLAGQIATLIRGSVVYAEAGTYVLTGLANIMARASIPQIYKRVRNSYARLKGYARDVILKE